MSKINWIAEIGSNHNQNSDRMYGLISEAKARGFDYVKLQKFDGKKLISGENNTNIELSDELFMEAVSICKSKGIGLGCSVFDDRSFNFVNPYCDFIKISSFDVLRKDLIGLVITKSKRTIISFGMVSDDFVTSIAIDNRKYNNTVFMHCISKYPAMVHECRMNKFDGKAFTYLKEHKNNEIGWSDHTVNEIAILTAISKGATWIETHIDLDDMRGAESYHGHVWSLNKIGKLIYDYNACCKYEDEFQGNTLNMADPIDGMRPPKEMR